MTARQVRRLMLELEPGSEPIRGQLVKDGGEGRRFVGWLGLAVALQQAMRLNQSAAPEEQSQRPMQ